MDNYCSQMSSTGEGEFFCGRAANVPPMKARYSYNKNGGGLGWRCYAYFEDTNDSASCISDTGDLTNQGCSDPVYEFGRYCTRFAELQACDKLRSYKLFSLLFYFQSLSVLAKI